MHHESGESVVGQLKLVQSIAKIGWWSWDIESGKVTWCDQAYEIFRAARETPSLAFAKQFVHPDDVEFWQTTIEAAVREKRPFGMDHRAVRADGEIIWVHNDTECVFDAQGELTGYQGTVQDVTSRKCAEEALRQSESFLHSTLDSFCDNIAVLDDQGLIVLTNQAWRRFAAMNGAQPEAVSEGTNYLRVCDSAEGEGEGEDATQARLFARHIRRILSGEEDESFELEYPCHSPDTERWFLGRVTRVWGDIPPCAVVVHTDITKRRHAAANLAQDAERFRMLALELANTEDRERRRISDYIHDQVGQSLAAIRLKINAWKRMKPSPKPTRLLAEIDQLLDATAETMRTLTFELSPPILFSLGLGSAFEWLGEHLLEREAIAFEFHDDGRCPKLDDALAGALYRAVRELLLNVVKHAHAKRVLVSLAVEQGLLQVCVADDGVGIAVVQCDHALNGRTGTYGLFSVKERLRYLQGTLDIVSSTGEGTRVTLKVPVQQTNRTDTP